MQQIKMFELEVIDLKENTESFASFTRFICEDQLWEISVSWKIVMGIETCRDKISDLSFGDETCRHRE